MPKLGKTGSQSLLGKVAYAHDVRGAILNRIQLSMLYKKKTGRVYKKEDHVPKHHQFTFKDISPHHGLTFHDMDDGFRIN